LGRDFLGDNIKTVKKKFSSIFFTLYLLTPPFFFGTPNLVLFSETTVPIGIKLGWDVHLMFLLLLIGSAQEAQKCHKTQNTTF
jgi:hypothetical protein